MVFMAEDEYIVHRKYDISMVDGTEIEEEATFFVIRVDAGQPEQKMLLAFSRMIEPIDQTFATCVWALARQLNFDAFIRNGIKQKYIVKKLDGSPIDKKARYFVFRLDDNEAERIAVEYYADLIEGAKPRMARQLKELCDARTWERFGLDEKTE
jgi:hypothetical protein